MHLNNPTNWKMPAVKKGNIVEWFPGGVRDSEKSSPAIVLQVCHASVGLRIFGVENDLRFTCVKHVDDPFSKEFERGTDGGWSHFESPEPKAK